MRLSRFACGAATQAKSRRATIHAAFTSLLLRSDCSDRMKRLGGVTMIGTKGPRRSLVHRLGFAAAALLALAAVPGRPAQAMSPVAPGAMPPARPSSDVMTIQMRGPHGGGGGGGF